MKRLRHTRVLIYIAVLLCSFPSIVFAEEIPLYGYKVINTFPHDSSAFTQGLLFNKGSLYESTGNYGHSSLRKVELETGNVIQIKKIDDSIFAEGLTLFQQQLIQLSWRKGSAFVYDKDSFDLIKTFNYPGEGWGLTTYKDQLIMSDGSSVLRFLDPKTFKQTNSISVSLRGKQVKHLNELEIVKGNIFANIWLTNQIVIISPQSGQVTAVIDLTGLLASHASRSKANVLNGIAYDPQGDRLFVTGKFWPKLFEIKITH